jgi:hypothetical protein
MPTTEQREELRQLLTELNDWLEPDNRIDLNDVLLAVAGSTGGKRKDYFQSMKSLVLGWDPGKSAKVLKYIFEMTDDVGTWAVGPGEQKWPTHSWSFSELMIEEERLAIFHPPPEIEA